MDFIQISYYLHKAKAEGHLTTFISLPWIDVLVRCLARGYYGNPTPFTFEKAEGPCWPANVPAPCAQAAP
jgi:hypothetical protein